MKCSYCNKIDSHHKSCILNGNTKPTSISSTQQAFIKHEFTESTLDEAFSDLVENSIKKYRLQIGYIDTNKTLFKFLIYKDESEIAAFNFLSKQCYKTQEEALDSALEAYSNLLI